MLVDRDKLLHNPFFFTTGLPNFLSYTLLNAFFTPRCRFSEYTRQKAFDKSKLTVSGIYGEIARDVVRTYQSFQFFKRGHIGCHMLFNILSAVATLRPDVGYCQVCRRCSYNISSFSNQPRMYTHIGFMN
jgi:hypothetical protein